MRWSLFESALGRFILLFGGLLLLQQIPLAVVTFLITGVAMWLLTKRQLSYEVSLLYGRVLIWGKVRPLATPLAHNIYLGSQPLEGDRHALEDIAPTYWLSLLTAQELHGTLGSLPLDPHSIAPNVCQIEMVEYAAPTQKQIEEAVAFIHMAVEAQKTIYVHCKAGRGRSAMVIAAYLASHHDLSAANAWDYIVLARPCVTLTTPQKKVLQAYVDRSTREKSESSGTLQTK